jgi:hypothetical protein
LQRAAALTQQRHAILSYFFRLVRRRRPAVVRLRLPRFLRAGTFAPDRRASDKPIAIACLRLFTLRPERPLRSVPRFRSRIARATFVDAFLL